MTGVGSAEGTSWVKYMNSAYAETFGVNPVLAIGQHIKTVIGETAYKTIEKQVDIVLSGTPQSVTTFVPDKSGGILQVYNVYLTPDINNSGIVKGYYACIMEITETYYAQLKVRQSEEQLRLITDSVPVLISYVDSEYRYQFNNRRYEEVFAQDAKNMRGKHMSEIIGSHAFSVSLPNIEKALNGTPITFVESSKDKSGKLHHLNGSFLPDIDENGTVQGYYSVIMDVTELHETQMKLQESERQLRQISDSVPVLISYVDRDLNYQFNNKRYEEMFGKTVEELKGKPISSLIGAGTSANIKPHVEKVLSGLPTTFKQTVTAMGKEVPLTVSFFPDSDNNGVVVGFFTSILDITDLTLKEEELAKSDARWKSVFEYASDQIALVGPEGDILTLNRADPVFKTEVVEGQNCQ